ncbi:rhomboid family intramembrane serine protease [Allorhizocola rhizosphaerae]|uniref:rhomboid family intramembrane serine protease n=1 Tax=Allorhizocola rhizosphaerae TaxID=1872709 RepID=UPI000E3C8209|nr:rhomboid family intramembrane serine protease [Allorhizocola rhizosphaerae]
MVLPVHDVNPVRRFPVVTLSLIVANVISFLTTPAANVCELNAFLYEWGAIPLELMRNEPLQVVPTQTCGFGPPSYDKQVALSVLFSMFLHAGWLHLLGNMLFLWIFGNNVEDRLGHVRFLLFYAAAGYVAAYAFALSDPTLNAPLIGASGAVSGVLGAYLVLFPWARVWSLVIIIPLPLPAWLVLGVWFVLQWIYSSGYAVEAGSVAYLAHIIGFLFGVLMAIPLRGRRPQRRRVQ